MVYDPNTKQLNNAIVYTLMNPNVVISEPPNENIYNILFEDWKILNVDGLSCESLSPFDPKAIDEFKVQNLNYNENVDIENVSDLVVFENNIFVKNVKMESKYYESEKCKVMV